MWQYEGGFRENTLYACMKFSIKKKNRALETSLDKVLAHSHIATFGLGQTDHTSVS